MHNRDLIQKVVQLTNQERRIGVEILELLQEIERRKAYSELGYDGLFSFCVKELRYSEAQAARRIQAMRALRELPELKADIQSGVLTVTTVSQVQNHLRKKTLAGEAQSKSEKLELFQSVQNQSAKEVEFKLNLLSGGEDLFTLVLKLKPNLKVQWDQIKNLSAHSTAGRDSEVFELLMKEWLKRNDPSLKLNEAKKHIKTQAGMQIEPSATGTSVKKEEVQHKFDRRVPAIQQKLPPKGGFIVRSGLARDGLAGTRTVLRSAIPAAIKRTVWNRDQGRCVKCSSRFALQYDHIQPFALGGDHSVDNLRLLCRNCNLHAGIQNFGLKKMKRFTTASESLSSRQG